MSTITHLPNEADAASVQRSAFTYLREQARSAHVDGDGMQCLHLSSIAIRSALDLKKDNKLQLELRELYWSIVFSAYWMIRSYTLIILVSEVKPSLLGSDPQPSSLHKLLETLLALISEPLMFNKALIDDLHGIEWSWIENPTDIEAITLLTFISELVWYHTVTDGGWKTLLLSWETTAPPATAQALRHTRFRLEAQAALSRPESPPLNTEGFGFDATTQGLYDLWHAALQCDLPTVERLQNTMVPRLRADSWIESQVAKILFDFHHATRFATSDPGDAQELGLTRRQFLSSGSKVNAVAEARDALFYELFTSILRQGRNSHKPSERFECARLAMYKEIFALKSWDYGDWREALDFQSAYCLEGAYSDSSVGSLACRGVVLAVQARAYKGVKDLFTRRAIDLIQWTEGATLIQTCRDLYQSHPLQWYDALNALGDISDAIPEVLLNDIATWSVQFVTELQDKIAKGRGSTIAPLAFWKVILENVVASDVLCKILAPAFSFSAKTPGCWLGEGGEVYETFLRLADRDTAIGIAEQISSVKPVDNAIEFARWKVLYNATQKRPELFTANVSACLERSAGKPFFAHHLARKKLGLTNDIPLSDQALKNWFHAQLMKAGPTSDEIGTPVQAFGFVPWSKNDKKSIDKIVSLIENPESSCMVITILLNGVAAIVSTADDNLFELLCGISERWLAVPPVGINRNNTGAFSRIRNTEPTQGDVEDRLGYLALQIFDRKGSSWLPSIRPWLSRAENNWIEDTSPFSTVITWEMALASEGAEQDRMLQLTIDKFQMALSHANCTDEWKIALRRVLINIHNTLSDRDKVSRIDPKCLTRLLDAIVANLSRIVRHDDPRIRKASARLLLRCEILGRAEPAINELKSQFRRDPRARIRKVFSGPLP